MILNLILNMSVFRRLFEVGLCLGVTQPLLVFVFNVVFLLSFFVLYFTFLFSFIVFLF